MLKDPRLGENPLRAPVLDGLVNAEAARPTANFRDAEFWKVVENMLLSPWLGDVQPTDAFSEQLNSEMQRALDLPVS